jgi:hypothetical protein
VNAEQFIKRLDKVRPCGDGWEARCPAHEDNRASLTIGNGDNGSVVFHCQTGCKQGDVVRALGLKMRDLFPRKGDDPRAPKRKPAKAPGKPKRWRSKPTYVYHDADGSPVYGVVRRKDKAFPQCHWDATDRCWRSGRNATAALPYHLPKLLEARRGVVDDVGVLLPEIWITEGEKDVESLERHGFVATTISGGARNIGKEAATLARYLEAASVVLCGDADEPGRRAMSAVGDALAAVADDVRVIDLAPYVGPGGDVTDYLEDHTADELRQLATSAPRFEPTAKIEEDEGEEYEPNNDDDRSSMKEALLALVDNLELFHDGAAAFASVTIPERGDVAEHTEHLRVCDARRKPTAAFEEWLRFAHYRHVKASNGKLNSPSDSAIREVSQLVAVRARYEGPSRSTHRRIAEHDGKVYVDMGDPAWRAFEVDAEGWRIVSKPPVAFERRSGMRAFPDPERGGSLNELATLINAGAPDGDNFRFAVAWIVSALLPPPCDYAILAIRAEQGSGKSWMMERLRDLTDPADVPTSGLPREERDLAISAHNSWVLSYSNISSVPLWASDGLARIATGGGFRVRANYSDDEEAAFSSVRPIMLEGISEFIGKGDLADRAVRLSLPPLLDTSDKATLGARWAAAYPRILGAVLDALSGVLRELPTTKPNFRVRMADFARQSVALERVLGWEPDWFRDAYLANRRDGQQSALESSPIGDAMLAFVEQLQPDASLNYRWLGDAKALLSDLADAGGYTTSDGRPLPRPRGWPTHPRGLRSALTRIAPALRQNGIDLEFGERLNRKSNRGILVTYTPEGPDEDGFVDPVADGCADGPQTKPSAQPSAQKTNNGKGLQNADGADGRSGGKVVNIGWAGAVPAVEDGERVPF